MISDERINELLTQADGLAPKSGSIFKSLARLIEAEVIARIDAERGKEAVAWVEVIDRHEGPYNFHGKEFLDSGRHDLFLSPTIPEGMALDADRYRFFKEHMHDIEFLSDLGCDVTPDELDSGIDSAMLAAAQGERNAD